MKKFSHLVAAIIGNLLEHFDHYLFIFLAPFFSSLFFHSNVSPLISLILTFAIMPLGLASRPFGALFFGKIGDEKGIEKALILSLSGMAATTFLIGLLPTYNKVGPLSFVLLTFLRLCQNFFAAGEVTGGALLALEKSPHHKRSFYSSLYDSSSVLGILLASIAVYLFAHFELILTKWRLLYFGSCLTAFFGIFLRHFLKNSPSREPSLYTPILSLIWKEKKCFFTLCLGIGFSYAIYHSTTTLINGYLPFISKLSQSEALATNTKILAFDLLLLPLFGWISTFFSFRKIMSFSLITVSIAAPFLFSLLFNANETRVFVVRIILVILGVGFSAPLYAWAYETAPSKGRYRFIALASVVGSQLFGGSSCVIGLWLYHLTHWSGAPGLFLSLIAFCTLLTISFAYPNFRKGTREDFSRLKEFF